jgi:hypothetical protein
MGCLVVRALRLLDTFVANPLEQDQRHVSLRQLAAINLLECRFGSALCVARESAAAVECRAVIPTGRVFLSKCNMYGARRLEVGWS